MTPPLLYLAVGVLLGAVGIGLVGVVCARAFVQGFQRELAARLAAPSLAPDLDEARITQRVLQAPHARFDGYRP